MKPYRSKEDFNDERKWKRTYPLDDVDEVGKQKAIGYVCATDGGLNPLDGAWSIGYLKVLGKFFKQKGKLTYIRPADDNLGCKSLWVGDPTMMQAVLDRHTKLLEKNNCPTDATKFFQWICNTDIAHKENPKMYHMVCELFNSWCLWCER